MNTALRAAGCVVAAGIALASTPNANATPMTLTISVEDLVTHQVFTTPFTDAATPNLIDVGTASTGPITFTGETATSAISPPINTLITSALTITNTNHTDPVMVTATLAGRNFVGPDNFVSLTGSGTWFGTPNSVMTLAFYDDPTNNGLATLAQRVGFFVSPPALDPTSSYSYSPGTVPLAIPDTGPFSMTETWTYTLAPDGRLVSRGQTETKSEVVPEPSTLLLLGFATFGVGMIRFKRNISRRRPDVSKP
ncbi:MAG TPA: PEP-CTERM sorting domain-containing protein [Rhodopila sp.]